MHLGTPGDDLVRGVLIKRYKRFLADCQLDSGEFVTAHCPNTGSMKTLLANNAPVWLKTHNNPKRKLAHTLTLLGVKNEQWALIDTALPNHLVAEAIEAGRIPELGGYGSLRKEVPYGSRRSRIDLFLEQPDPSQREEDERACYVEIKNVTMASPEVESRADFPDAVTTRGRKHLMELADMVEAGYRCVQFYLLGRGDCDAVGIAESIDPDYAEELRQAMARGVEVLTYMTTFRDGDLVVTEACPFEFDL